MKKILLLLFFSGACILNAHQQSLHQHIVREAFKLLLLSCPELQNSEMVQYIGNSENNSNSGYNSWGDGTVAAGAFLEDEYDIVYHYGLWDSPNFNQTITPEIYSIFFMNAEQMRHSLTSITHFWNADGGLNQPINILTDIIIIDVMQKAI